MGTQLKWGIAGVGMIAHDFLTAMGTLPPGQHKVVAIAGKDIERAHRLATLHKISTAYEGYESLARDESIGTLYCLSVILSGSLYRFMAKNQYLFIHNETTQNCDETKTS